MYSIVYMEFFIKREKMQKVGFWWKKRQRYVCVLHFSFFGKLVIFQVKNTCFLSLEKRRFQRPEMHGFVKYDACFGIEKERSNAFWIALKIYTIVYI